MNAPIWPAAPYRAVVSRTGGANGLPNIYVAGADGKKIAAVWGSLVARYDTAYLFAAAPDLYAALAEVLAASDAITVTVDDRDTGDINRLIAAETAGHAALRIAREGR